MAALHIARHQQLLSSTGLPLQRQKLAAMSLMNTASVSGVADTLDSEFEEKLLLHDGAPPLVARCYERQRERHRRHGEGGAGVDDGYRERFVRAYDRLRDELVSEDSCELTDEARHWVAQMIDYNVPGGKLNRGLSLIDSYFLLKEGSEVTEDEFFLACVLGWCVEWFQACALVLDDIMDDSHTRRDQICWYKRPEVGLRGINDGVLLKCHITRLIKKYFREKPYYIDMCDLWNEIALQTSLGQMLDLISTHNGPDNLAKYNIEGYHRIVKYKTSYYSFYLPVACALLLSGAKYLLKWAYTFKHSAEPFQDDYLDCFADPSTIGKIGTDIEDHKCSWLIVQALGHADRNQIEVLQDYYGKKDSASVPKVKSTYTALDLKDIFSEFEDRAFKHLVTSIEAQKDRAMQDILKSFLKKIYRRKK